MPASRMDHLSGGRSIFGLGVSGPQVVEGWYGQSSAKPLARTREYLAIMRQVFAREGPVVFEGEHYPIPYAGGPGRPAPAANPDREPLGKAPKPIVHPLRAHLPLFMGAQGPKNGAPAAPIADGWFPFPHAP